MENLTSSYKRAACQKGGVFQKTTRWETPRGGASSEGGGASFKVHSRKRRNKAAEFKRLKKKRHSELQTKRIEQEDEWITAMFTHKRQGEKKSTL